MTKFIKPLLVIVLFASLASCGTKAKPYPLDYCLVTDNALGSMGDPVVIVHEGQEVKFCCKPCIRKFNADPDKFLAKLNQSKSTKANEGGQ